MSNSKRSTIDPRTFLPLTPFAFQVLLALSDAPRHGYSIIREVSEQTDGLISLRTGTLYTLLQRLLDERLIEESNDRPHPDQDDERRRYYVVTSLGQAVAEAEAKRLEQVVGEARRKHVLKRSSKA